MHSHARQGKYAEMPQLGELTKELLMNKLIHDAKACFFFSFFLFVALRIAHCAVCSALHSDVAPCALSVAQAHAHAHFTHTHTHTKHTHTHMRPPTHARTQMQRFDFRDLREKLAVDALFDHVTRMGSEHLPDDVVWRLHRDLHCQCSMSYDTCTLVVAAVMKGENNPEPNWGSRAFSRGMGA